MSGASAERDRVAEGHSRARIGKVQSCFGYLGGPGAVHG
jgi:hypothetical protein